MPKKRINITIAPELITKLQEEARTHCHSLSNEIEYRLTQSLITPASDHSTPVVHTEPFIKPTLSENPTGDSIITADGHSHKKHPLIWLQENNIDPMDTNSDTFHRFQKVYPDTTVLEFYDYQQSRRKK